MGFGAIITSGEGFTVVKDIMPWITEARVEMELSKPTKFALRFDDDICEGDPEVARNPALKSNEMIGIFVRVREELHCLVFGPITRVRTSSMVGGTGSWLEVHGEDRRVVMNRVGIQASWTGLASDAASAILAAYDITSEVEPTLKNYEDAQHCLSQRATDLAFLEDIARRNVLEFWLDYEPSEVPGTGGISCTYTARIKSSPPKGGEFLVPGPPVLTADAGFVIDVQPPPDHCAKVTKFEAKVDYERPNAALGFGQAPGTGESVQTPGEDTIEPVTPDWTTLRQIDGVERTALAPAVTDPDEQQLAERAMLNEAAWFVEVDCSTTLALIDFCVKPHMIVDVQHAGDRLSGAYQVKTATHVINATDHFIDFKLRANGLRQTGAH
jgi:hypothetical protein